MIRTVIAALLYAPALFLFFSEVLGLYRFRYVLNRMQAVGLGDTLGLLLIIAGTTVLRGLDASSLKMLLIPAFLFLTGPVETHLIAGGEVMSNDRAGEEYTLEDRR